MKSETLQVKEAGPLRFEVFGSSTLCIEEAGTTNLDPFTATVRIRNTGSKPVVVNYSLDPLRSFRAKAVWPATRPGDAAEFSDCCGDAGAPTTAQKTISGGDALLISSWTRHHDHIQRQQNPAGKALIDILPREYVVRFDLAITYDTGAGPIPVAESFAIPFLAVPVVLEDN